MRIAAFAIAVLSVAGVAACSQPAPTDPAAAEAPATAVAADLATVAAGTWTASGSEPFWELKVVPGQPLDVTVEGVSFDATGPYAAPVMAADGSAVISTGNLVVTMRAGPCLAIGPTRFPYSVTVAVDGAAEPAYTGCAETPTDQRVALDEATGQPVAAEQK